MTEQQGSKYEQWVARGDQYSRRTKMGTVIALKINVNKAGHGFLYHMTDKGKGDQPPYPVMNVEEAVDALRTLWAQAVEKANTPVSAESATGDDTTDIL